jgi:hypothetical protein
VHLHVGLRSQRAHERLLLLFLPPPPLRRRARRGPRPQRLDALLDPREGVDRLLVAARGRDAVEGVGPLDVLRHPAEAVLVGASHVVAGEHVPRARVGAAAHGGAEAGGGRERVRGEGGLERRGDAGAVAEGAAERAGEVDIKARARVGGGEAAAGLCAAGEVVEADGARAHLERATEEGHGGGVRVRRDDGRGVGGGVGAAAATAAAAAAPVEVVGRAGPIGCRGGPHTRAPRSVAREDDLPRPASRELLDIDGGLAEESEVGRAALLPPVDRDRVPVGRDKVILRQPLAAVDGRADVVQGARVGRT